MISDSSFPEFKMYGCREVLRFAGGALRIEQQVTTIEAAIFENPGLAFDLAKTLIETICYTILKDRSIPVDGTPDAQKLLSLTLHNLQLLPDDRSDATDFREGLRKTARGMIQTVQGLSEIRNSEGFASHGKDGYAFSSDRLQAILAAQAADAVVHFLYAVHKEYTYDPANARLRYEDHQDLNEYIDGIYDLIQLFEFTYSPSEVLFNVDADGYRATLIDFMSLEDETNDSFTPE